MSTLAYIGVLANPGMLTEAASMPPIRKIQKVFHVGTLDPSRKSGFSYEGRGVSVSFHPQEWMKIARGQVSGEIITLTKSNGQFLDFHKWNTTKRSKPAIEWGVSTGLIKIGTVYRISYYDDELEDEVYSDYPTREEAERNSDDTSSITEIAGKPTMTPKLSAYMGWKTVQSNLTMDALSVAYAESIGLDGVWWNDVLDVGKLSAPRGVILPTKLNTWSVQRSNNSLTEATKIITISRAGPDRED